MIPPSSSAPEREARAALFEAEKVSAFTAPEDALGRYRRVTAALRALLDAQEPAKLVTIKLAKNPNHNPHAKVTGPCAVSSSCTDSTGEHHTVLIHSDAELEFFRDMHITRIEVVD